VKSLNCADHHPIRIGDEHERLVGASPAMTKSRAPAGGINYPANGLVKPPRHEKGPTPSRYVRGKAPLSLSARKSRTHAPAAPMRSAPACFLSEWGSIN